MMRLMTPPPLEREAYVEHALATQRVIGSPGFELDEATVRARVARAYDRSFHPPGNARQVAAIMASPPRDEGLRSVDLPTLVIHGAADPLVPVEGGLDTHECIANSEWMLIEGMGHDLPLGVWPRIIDGISKLTERSDRAG
jgi:pimeloyl-ACP methyl ester carboxylesterase